MMGTNFRKSVEDIVSGAWFPEYLAAWQRGDLGLLTVEPQPSSRQTLNDAIQTMLATNQSYEQGDHVIIHARPSGIEMGAATAYILHERGIDAQVVVGFHGLGTQVQQLMKAVYGDQDLSKADDTGLQGLHDAYAKLFADLDGGRAHWLLTTATSLDLEPEHVPAMHRYLDAVTHGIHPGLEALRSSGSLKSQEIWFNPTGLDVERLNAELPQDKHWTLEEWQDAIFRAMGVSGERLHEIAMGLEAVQLTIEASLHGGTLRYTRDDGTDFTYQVTGRPVLLDCGRPGNISIGATAPLQATITNQPTTEVYVAPKEDSMDGRIVYNSPMRTPLGIIQAPYDLDIRAGNVAGVQAAPEGDSMRILRHYTGRSDYDHRELNEQELAAFVMRGIIAEVAIAGFNPVLEPYIRQGRLPPVIGLTIIDEKLGDHQAFGANSFFGGLTPATHAGYSVDHTDLVGGIDRMLRLEKE